MPPQRKEPTIRRKYVATQFELPERQTDIGQHSFPTLAQNQITARTALSFDMSSDCVAGNP